MRFTICVLLGLLAVVLSDPDFSIHKVDGKEKSEPNIVQFNIQCVQQPGDDQVGSAAEESPAISSLRDKKPRNAIDNQSPLPTLKERLETLRKDKPDLKNLLLSKTQDTVGSSSADQPDIKAPLKEKLDNIKERISNSDAAEPINKLKEKISEFREKSRSDIVGAAQNLPSPSTLKPPSLNLEKLREKIDVLKEKPEIVKAMHNDSMARLNESLNKLREKKPRSDIVGAANDISAAFSSPPNSTLKEKIEKAKSDIVGAANDVSAVSSPALDKLKEKMAKLKERARSDIVGAAQNNSPVIKLQSLDQIKNKLKEKFGDSTNKTDVVEAALPDDELPVSNFDDDEVATDKPSSLDKLKEKLNELKEKRKNDVVGAAQNDRQPSILPVPNTTLGKLKEKLNELKDKPASAQADLDSLKEKITNMKEKSNIVGAVQQDLPSPSKSAMEKMKEKLNNLKEKSRKSELVGAAQNIPTPATLPPPASVVNKLKDKLDELKGRSANIAPAASENLIRIREKLNNLKDTVGAAQNTPQPSLTKPDSKLQKLREKIENLKDTVGSAQTLPSPSTTLKKFRERLNDLRDVVGASQNFQPEKSPPSTLDRLKEKLEDLRPSARSRDALVPPLNGIKERIAEIRGKLNNDQRPASSVLSELRERANDIRRKVNSDLVGSPQNESPVVNLLDPLNRNSPRRSSGVLPRQISARGIPSNDRIGNTMREITRFIPPIQLPTLEARLIPAPIQIGNPNPPPAVQRIIEPIIAPSEIRPMEMEADVDNTGRASNERVAAAAPSSDDEVLLEPDEDQEPSAPSKQTKLDKLAETIKARTAEVSKPGVNRITSAIDNLKKKLDSKKDVVGSESKALSREVSYGGISQKEVEKKSCDICSCLMKYLGNSEEPVVGAAAPRTALSKTPKKTPRLKLFRDQSGFEDRIRPSIALPPSGLSGRGKALNSLIPSNDDNENIQKLVEFANLVEELDDYLSKKTKSVIARLSKVIDAGSDDE